MPSAQLMVGSELALLAAVFDHPQKGIVVSCKAETERDRRRCHTHRQDSAATLGTLVIGGIG
jgi:hypothetical protein